MSVTLEYSLQNFSKDRKAIFTLITVLIFIVSLSCTQYDQQYFDSMAELFAKQSGTNVSAVCLQMHDNYSLKEVYDHHKKFNSGDADGYIYVLKEIKPENTKTKWGYLQTGVTIYADRLAFQIWDEKLRSEKSKSWAMNVGAIWHEFLHLSLYLKDKAKYCYSDSVHKSYSDMSKWLMYDKNLKLVKPEPYGYYLKQYWYAIQPKPAC